MKDLRIKRIYEPAEKADGFRILVDRLWPRGVKKETAGIDLWLKDVAPSTELRQWFHIGDKDWQEFRHKYLLELKHNPAAHELAGLIEFHKVLTLLYAAKDEHQNHALVLKEFISDK
ncbi:MAG: DUF488 domain-containing protein [Bacteroidota bacterium]